MSAASFLHLALGDATYEFRRCAWGLRWARTGGLYLFLNAADGTVIYIGETARFSSRLPNHEIWPLAQHRGATDVYAMSFGGSRRERRALERALIAAYKPACNTHHCDAPIDGVSGVGFDPFDSFDAVVRQLEV